MGEIETVKVEIELPADYVRFLKYVFDDNPEESLDSYVTRCLESEFGNMLAEGHDIGNYLLPKIKRLFPGLP